MIVFSRSSPSWMLTNIRCDRLKNRATTSSSTGSITSRMTASEGQVSTASTMLPSSVSGARMKMRISERRAVCTCVTSLVSRVTRLPVPSVSRSRTERDCTLRKSAPRTPAAKACVMGTTRIVFARPQTAPANASPTISRPVWITSVIFSPTMPLSTIVCSRRGWSRSAVTSPIISSGAMMTTVR